MRACTSVTLSLALTACGAAYYDVDGEPAASCFDGGVAFEVDVPPSAPSLPLTSFADGRFACLAWAGGAELVTIRSAPEWALFWASHYDSDSWFCEAEAPPPHVDFTRGPLLIRFLAGNCYYLGCSPFLPLIRGVVRTGDDLTVYVDDVWTGVLDSRCATCIQPLDVVQVELCEGRS